MSEENTQPEEPSMADRLRDSLSKFEGAPAPEMITGWKENYGDVYVSAFSEDEIFIFRSLSRSEYTSLQERAATEQLDALAYEEESVKTCLLWSSVQDLNRKAGTIPSLMEMIMQNSNFVPPQVAAQLVAKL